MVGVDWKRFRVNWQRIQAQVTHGKALIKADKATNTPRGRAWVRALEIQTLKTIKRLVDEELDIAVVHARDVLGMSFADIGAYWTLGEEHDWKGKQDAEDHWKAQYEAAVRRLEDYRGQFIGSGSLLRHEWELERKFAMERARSEEIAATKRRGNLRVVRTKDDGR
ncbi:hypothetical protein [Spelaeicoccus albus]|uniref:Uncharacterized protein n=2 Tax=Spelaeicoccus albus TaxID=1280376 RepID=A0A7Z0A7X9_9MICO|nr:hypothetical protein [Spelaeicoccus albus]